MYWEYPAGIIMTICANPNRLFNSWRRCDGEGGTPDLRGSDFYPNLYFGPLRHQKLDGKEGDAIEGGLIKMYIMKVK